jgi:tetratricopeptide (TPR) repeat protein
VKRRASNGVGVDFGSMVSRVAIARATGPVEYLPLGTARRPRSIVHVDAQATRGSLDIGHGRWLRLESMKSALGSESSSDDAGLLLDAVQGEFDALRRQLERHLRAKLLSATFSVPACYGVQQRAALRRAGEQAGFGDVALIDEPLAATVACYSPTAPRRRILVFCLGESLFSASVIEAGGGLARVVGTEGSTHIGAQDLDALLVQSLLTEHLERHGSGVSLNAIHLERLLACAESARSALDIVPEALVDIGLLDARPRAYAADLLAISRDRLDRAITPAVDEMLRLARRAAAASGRSLEDVDGILLVGRAAGTRMIAEQLTRTFGCPLTAAPETAIAAGAALIAGSTKQCFDEDLQSETERQETEPVSSAPTEIVATSAPGDEVGDDRLLRAVHAVRAANRPGNPATGIGAFRQLLAEASEELSYVYSKQAAELRVAGRLGDAQRALEAGLKCWPGNDHARRSLSDVEANLALMDARHGLLDPCKKHIRISLQLDPANAIALQLQQQLAQLDKHAKRSRRSRGGR